MLFLLLRILTISISKDLYRIRIKGKIINTNYYVQKGLSLDPF